MTRCKHLAQGRSRNEGRWCTANPCRVEAPPRQRQNAAPQLQQSRGHSREQTGRGRGGGNSQCQLHQPPSSKHPSNDMPQMAGKHHAKQSWNPSEATGKGKWHQLFPTRGQGIPKATSHSWISFCPQRQLRILLQGDGPSGLPSQASLPHVEKGHLSQPFLFASSFTGLFGCIFPQGRCPELGTGLQVKSDRVHWNCCYLSRGSYQDRLKGICLLCSHITADSCSSCDSKSPLVCYATKSGISFYK